MMEQRPELTDFYAFLKELESLDFEALTDWLRLYYSGRPIEPSYHSRKEKFLLVKDIFLESDDGDFRDRMCEAVSCLLENVNPDADCPEYLFCLLNFACNFKSQNAKKQLRRLLYSGTIDDSLTYNNVNLTGMLVNANTKYDIDQQLKFFIFKRLPEYPHFGDFVIPVYNSIISSYDKNAFLFIPETAVTWKDPLLFSAFQNLFHYSVEQMGFEALMDSFVEIGTALYAREDKSLLDTFVKLVSDLIESSPGDFSSELFAEKIVILYSQLDYNLSIAMMRVLIAQNRKEESRRRLVNKLIWYHKSGINNGNNMIYFISVPSSVQEPQPYAFAISGVSEDVNEEEAELLMEVINQSDDSFSFSDSRLPDSSVEDR